MIREDNCLCEDDPCKAIIRDCGSKCNACDFSGTLEIFKEFNEVYKERLKKAEEACGDISQLKIKTLEDWVADLTEQNTVLVETVEALEREALYRLELGINAQKCSELEVTGAGSTGRFYDGLKKDLDIHRKLVHDGEKQNPPLSIVHNNPETGKDCKACKTRGKIQVEGRGYITSSGTEINTGSQPDPQMEELQEKLYRAEEEISLLKNNLTENELKLEKINEEIKASEKSAREMRAALTAEVADKHDQVLSLRREVQHLEEKLRQADMQTHFKDDIIKELRKEIKVSNNKLSYLGLDVIPSSSKPVNCHLSNSKTPDNKNKMNVAITTSYDPSHDMITSWSKNYTDNKYMPCNESSSSKKEHRSEKQSPLLKQTLSNRNLNYNSSKRSDLNNELCNKNFHSNYEINYKGKCEQHFKKLSKKTSIKNPPVEEMDMLEYSCGDCIT